MVEVGSIIRAKVSRIEPYGVWFEHTTGPLLVLAPEVSWCDHRPFSEWIRLGDEFDVLVLRYNYRDRVIVGSIRRLQPAQNPYRQLARLEPGTVLHGNVVLSAGDALTVELAYGAWGLLPRNLALPSVKRGDRIDVVITALEVDEGRMTLGPAPFGNGRPADTPLPQPVGMNA